jgi:hypothetical protein
MQWSDHRSIMRPEHCSDLLPHCDVITSTPCNGVGPLLACPQKGRTQFGARTQERTRTWGASLRHAEHRHRLTHSLGSCPSSIVQRPSSGPDGISCKEECYTVLRNVYHLPSPGLKRLQREADYLSACSAEVRHSRTMPARPPYV